MQMCDSVSLTTAVLAPVEATRAERDKDPKIKEQKKKKNQIK